MTLSQIKLLSLNELALALFSALFVAIPTANADTLAFGWLSNEREVYNGRIVALNSEAVWFEIECTRGPFVIYWKDYDIRDMAVYFGTGCEPEDAPPPWGDDFPDCSVLNENIQQLFWVGDGRSLYTMGEIEFRAGETPLWAGYKGEDMVPFEIKEPGEGPPHMRIMRMC